MENKTNWFDLMLELSDKANKEGHKDLAKKLENIAVNHTPETK